MFATWPWIKSSPFGKSGTKSANRDLFSKVEQYRRVPESELTGLQRLERDRLCCPWVRCNRGRLRYTPGRYSSGTDSISNPIEKGRSGNPLRPFPFLTRHVLMVRYSVRQSRHWSWMFAASQSV